MIDALPERIARKIEPEPNSGCWLWNAAISTGGYGRVQVGRKLCQAHRVVFELSGRAIPTGLELDHLCRVRRCVNPSHLEPVDKKTNLMRGEGAAARNARTTSCPHGHPYTQENTYYSKIGWRHCRRCELDRCARRYDSIRRGRWPTYRPRPRRGHE